ncbi:N-formylglutamate amidohydrolase [Parasphingopyxis sp. CP4]|uniref:N-formylglutamate amidohydrolase n=1 Tax=Parasphingopyxis sp. CP4 TaxID=2724527 RepID=UPI0015A16E62|nr:N-formylglutamate amidohydrolase [Parasphingopyxis sp. CP4]QLC21098.1 N-formylglutamate amidohydrolase [Parasphingopyxis sp. CP4]
MENSGSEEIYLTQLGPTAPQSPVILSVPHAGRIYPDELKLQARLDETQLRGLEDRHVDRLVSPLAEQGYSVIIGTVARAWIDLNRSEREVDPSMIAPRPSPGSFDISAKVRGGLGLVPRRLGSFGNIYRHPLSQRDLADRIYRAHRPYHAAVSDMLDAARRRFGLAILLDCHSMPPLKPNDGTAPAKIVIGDRNGKSAAPIFAARTESICREAGFRTTLNSPYPGGHILARHGKPERDIHGLQLELCRSLYLDPSHDQLSLAHERITELIEQIADGLVDEAMSPPDSLAAE